LSTCKDRSKVVSYDFELLLLLFQVFRGRDINVYQLSVSCFCAGCPVVGLCKQRLMIMRKLQPERAGLICTEPPPQSASQDIRSDWWFCDGGRVSEHLIRITPTPLPAPSHCGSPICFSAALQGNQDRDTL